VQDKLMLDGCSWTLSEVPRHDNSTSSSSVAPRGMAVNTVMAGGRPDPPAVVTQHAQIDRQFVIINSKVLTP